MLINNAALDYFCPFEALSDELWDRLMAVNLRGHVCRDADRAHRHAGGRLGSDRQYLGVGSTDRCASHDALHGEQGWGDRVDPVAGA